MNYDTEGYVRVLCDRCLAEVEVDLVASLSSQLLAAQKSERAAAETMADVALKLADALQKIAELEARAEKAQAALSYVKESLQKELERGVITDTLWVANGTSETIFDFIDAAIKKGGE